MSPEKMILTDRQYSE